MTRTSPAELAPGEMFTTSAGAHGFVFETIRQLTPAAHTLPGTAVVEARHLDSGRVRAVTFAPGETALRSDRYGNPPAGPGPAWADVLQARAARLRAAAAEEDTRAAESELDRETHARAARAYRARAEVCEQLAAGETEEQTAAFEAIWSGRTVGFSEADLRAQLADHEATLAALRAGQVTPREVVGSGYRPAAARRVAVDWLTRRIRDTRDALATRGRSDAVNQDNVRARTRTRGPRTVAEHAAAHPEIARVLDELEPEVRSNVAAWVLPSDAAVTVGRFRPTGPTGYRSTARPATGCPRPLRATRAEAEADYLRALVADRAQDTPTEVDRDCPEELQLVSGPLDCRVYDATGRRVRATCDVCGKQRDTWYLARAAGRGWESDHGAVGACCAPAGWPRPRVRPARPPRSRYDDARAELTARAQDARRATHTAEGDRRPVQLPDPSVCPSAALERLPEGDPRSG